MKRIYHIRCEKSVYNFLMDQENEVSYFQEVEGEPFEVPGSRHKFFIHRDALILPLLESEKPIWYNISEVKTGKLVCQVQYKKHALRDLKAQRLHILTIEEFDAVIDKAIKESKIAPEPLPLQS